MESITEFFKEEKDPLYRKGEAKGRKEERKNGLEKERKRKEKIVINLLEKLGLSDEQAADVAGVPVTFVQEVRKEL